MQRDVLAPFAIALLCVVAIAVASATLTNPVSTAGFDAEFGEGGDSGAGDQWNPFSLNFSDGKEPSSGGGKPLNITGLCLTVLTTTWAQLLLVLALLAAAGWFYRKLGWIGAAAGFMALGPPGLVVYAFLTDCGTQPAAGVPWAFPQGNASNASGVGGTGGTGGGGAAFDPPVFLVVVAAVLAVVVVAAFVRSTGDDATDEDEAEPEPDEDDEALAAVGAVAGEAADRIDDASDVENEVYRAWRDMTDLLDVSSRETATPAEFRAAALEAGMRREHVSALTDAFREVRYGGREPTPEREERAVEALRAIEDAYAEEGSQ